MFKLAIFGVGCCALAAGQTQSANPKPVMIQMAEPAFGFSSVTAPFVWGAVDVAPLILNGSPVVGAPYTAQAVTTQTQVLADGNRIQQKSLTSIARDGQGRVRSERSIQGPSGSEELPKLVTIEDPVSGTNYSLDATSKSAFKMPSRPALRTTGGPAVAVGVAGPVTAPLPPPVPGAPHVVFRQDRLNSANVTTTDLGNQTMEGVLVQGKRTTRTIPAGTIGNDRDIVITSETWYSPDLQTLVSTKSDDPRIGETAYQLTNIQRVEPAASLFQVPADYTLKDQPAGNVLFHRTEVK